MSIEQIILQSSLDCMRNNLEQIRMEYQLVPDITDICVELVGKIDVLKDRLIRINAYEDYR